MAGVEGRHGAGRRHTWPEAQKKCLLLAVSSPVGCCTERRATSAADDNRPSRGGGRSMIARSRRSLARASSVEHRAVRAVQAPCGVQNAAARWSSALRTCVFLCGLGMGDGTSCFRAYAYSLRRSRRRYSFYSSHTRLATAENCCENAGKNARKTQQQKRPIALLKNTGGGGEKKKTERHSSAWSVTRGS